MEWGVVLYPGVAQPAGDPDVWVEPVFFDGWMNPAAALMPVIDPRALHGDIANFPALSLVDEPAGFFETVWFPGTGQQNQEVLMPIYDRRFLHGDIANMPFFSLILVQGLHYAANASGDFADPASFDITVRSGKFEIRRPL